MKKTILPRKIKDADTPPEKPKRIITARKIVDCLFVLVILAVIIAVRLTDFIHPQQACGGSYCGCTEQDAKNVLAALAAYFSEPENMRMPTIEVLISDADLSLNNPVENVILFPEPGELVQSQPISVVVIDYTERCPRNNAYIRTLGGGVGYWE